MTDLARAYRNEGPRLLSWLKKRLGSLEEAEDLLQEVFARAAQVRKFADPLGNILGWLYTTARNLVTDAWRNRSKDYSLEDVLEFLEADTHSDPDGIFRRTVVMEALEDAVKELPEEQSEVLRLQTMEGRTFKEVAEFLDISPNTAMSRKRYAVGHLRKRLENVKVFLD